MPTVTASITIDAPPQEVWKAFEDPNTYPDWVDPTQKMLETSDVPIQQGSTYKEYGGIKPFFGESTWTVTEYTPYTFQRHVGDEPTMHYDLAISLEPIEGGTRVSQVLELTPAWWLRPMNALLWPLMMRARGEATMAKTQANLKELVEG